MPLRLMQLYALFCLFAIQSQVYAQAISVNPDSLPSAVAEKVISYETLFVNGLSTYGPTDSSENTHIKLESIGKTALTALTLRLADQEQIKLHESISLTLPTILKRNPFKVAVTPHHILTETAGLAVPVIINDTPLKRYASHVRTAGQMAHDDSAAWAILMRFLEAKTGTPIAELFDTQLLQPLGLKASDLSTSPTTGLLVQYQNMSGSYALITEIARLTIRNRTHTGERFLSREHYDLMVRQQSWRMHPMTPNRTYGGILRRANGWQWLEPAPTTQGPSFMAFPDAGVAFVGLNGLTNDFKQAVLEVAHLTFLPARLNDRSVEAAQLVPYERFSGYYARADRPTAWLQDRLQVIQQHQLHILERNDGMLQVRLREAGDDIVRTYSPTVPFQYQTTSGSTITLSPYKSGGYLIMDGVLYRYVGILGNKFFVITLFPFVVIVLLSSGAYANSTTSRAWRRMGQFGFIGTLMICTGLACDYLWWPNALFEWNTPILVYAWRALINGGLMLILSLPLFALSFVRTNNMPEGKALLYVPLHLAMISIASAILFLILVAWGSAAEFSAY